MAKGYTVESKQPGSTGQQTPRLHLQEGPWLWKERLRKANNSSSGSTGFRREGRLAIWSEFHQRVDALPEEEREVFDLLWYQGLTQPNAAAVLGISEATLKRRWLAARQRLHKALKGSFPGS